ncbi:hypothetical protein [Burkholderia multivorans]|uniref:hypothetical protein n=1 Tax=Burkholderia multivorans TaxID=87883 RepID=UPI003EBA9E4E
MLLAYSKMWLYDALLESDLPEDPLVAAMLVDYFPKPLQQRFSERCVAIRCAAKFSRRI